MIVLILFILGLFLGSFVNVLAYRLPRGESTVWGRSHCDFCHKSLKVLELIPLLSFILQHGRCRQCKNFLSFWYPSSEIAAGLIVAGAYLFTFSACSAAVCWIPMILLSVVGLSFLGLFIADSMYQILPDVLVATAGLSGAGLKVFMLATGLPVGGIDTQLLRSVGVGAVLLALFLFLHAVTRGRGMGFGDVKLASVLGFIFGFPLGFVAVYLAFLTGGVVAAILMILGRKRVGQKVAFGPFLIVGALSSLVFEQQIAVFLNRFF